MDSAAIKLDMLERLAGVRDEAVIKRMATLLRKAFPEVMAGDEDEISDEEIAGFEQHHAAFVRGELKGITGKESVKRLRQAQRRDEAL